MRMPPVLHALCLFAVAAAPALAQNAAPAVVQKAAPAIRIVEKVDENQLVALKGNTLPVAIARNDLGRVSAGMKMTGLVLVLSRSQEQQAAFDDFVAGQYDASSPNYHHWLEPAEVGERFGPAQADIATVSAWLSSRGFTVEAVAKDRMSIRFGGTAGQVESAFHTEIHNLNVHGERHFANMSDPQIPAALAPVVQGIKALHNFFPKPLHRVGGMASFNSQTGKWQRVQGSSPAGSLLIGPPHAVEPSLTVNPAASSTPRPELGITIGSGSNASTIEDITPYDFATIYNVQPLWTAGTDGTGQTIAIVGTSKVKTTDVAAFRSAFGLPAGPTLQTIVADPNHDPGNPCTATTGSCTLGDQVENALDVEWSGAVAKGAQIVLVVAGSDGSTDPVLTAAQYVIDNKTAPVMSVSYGACELFEGVSGNIFINNLWETAAGEGIAVLVASGDAGSSGCDQGQETTLPYGAQFGNSVNALASTQYNTAVGGTDFNNYPSPSASYWSGTNSSNGSNAKNYVPEIPWNDSCTNPLNVEWINSSLTASDPQHTYNYTATQVCDYISTGQIYSSDTDTENFLLSLVDVVGAGGGASNCTTNTTDDTWPTVDPTSCSGGYAKPSWQTGVTGIPSDGKRDTPDLAFFSGDGLWFSAYLVYLSDYCIAHPSYCVSSTSPAVGPAMQVGGTSAATPAMAGVLALINQKIGAPQGNPNAELYKLAASQNYANCKAESVTTSGSCYFNDVDTGTIAMPCAVGEQSCTAAYSGDTIGVLPGNAASAGFDTASGLGSPNVANVVNGWTAATGGTASSTVTVTPASTTVYTGQSLSLTVAVTGANGQPLGTVSLSGGGYTGPSTILSADGTAKFTVPANTLSPGSVTFTASYSGDVLFASGTGTSAPVTVTASNFTPPEASTPAAINKGGTATSTITLSSTTSYTGTVALSCALTTSPTGAANVPTCTPGSPVTFNAGTASGPGTVTVHTTAATTSAMERPARPGQGLAAGAGGAVLALLVFFGIPARRRSWQALVGMVALAFALGGMAACGGGGGSSGSGGGNTGNPGTTSGDYTFTVAATGTPAVTPVPTTTFTVHVN